MAARHAPAGDPLTERDDLLPASLAHDPASSRPLQRGNDVAEAPGFC